MRAQARQGWHREKLFYASTWQALKRNAGGARWLNGHWLNIAAVAPACCAAAHLSTPQWLRKRQPDVPKLPARLAHQCRCLYASVALPPAFSRSVGPERLCLPKFACRDRDLGEHGCSAHCKGGIHCRKHCGQSVGAALGQRPDQLLRGRDVLHAPECRLQLGDCLKVFACSLSGMTRREHLAQVAQFLDFDPEPVKFFGRFPFGAVRTAPCAG